MRAVIILAFFSLVAVATAAQAQSSSSGLAQGRDCQTVRTCNFARGAAVRGCLSSYTCRVCRFVEARCTISGRERVCRQSVCTWGG